MSAKSGIRKVAIAADHRGVEMKKTLSDYLKGRGYEVADLGVHGEEASDYPDVAFPLSEKVAAGQFDRGILVCMSGTGMAICANKVAGIRAAVCDTEDQALLSRGHNDANVLIMGSKYVTSEEACRIAQAWLDAPFDGGRHEVRVNKIIQFEKRKK
jgi:ribose 5-phosphate isomerase B